MSNDKILDALLLAEAFIAQELENRKLWPDDESDYVREAESTLATIREALK